MTMSYGMLARLWSLQVLLLMVTTVLASPHEDVFDFTSYVSRPDIRAPKMTTQSYHNAAAVSGYYFTAPYYSLFPVDGTDTSRPFQIGPHIYDSRGELIWSAADLTRNFVATDFRPIVIDGKHHLSFILIEDDHATGLKQRRGYILDSAYNVIRIVNMTAAFDMHEWKAVNNAASFLRVTSEKVPVNTLLPDERVTVIDNCAVEAKFDGTETFRFCLLQRLGISETMYQRPRDDLLRLGWDPFHMNSVEKFPNGDYLISVRYTNAIYRVSSITQDVIWRLGGKSSDFRQDFSFSGQHDARIVSENDTVLVISFFDNAAVNHEAYMQTANFSSFKIVALYEHEEGRRAELLKSFDRPDRNLTRERGNGQYLSSGGAFVSWSKQGYGTDFAQDGSVVQEAKFKSLDLSTYRAYRAEWVGMPDSLPALKTFVSLDDRGEVLSISYVSWNGATEVATWEFYGSNEQEGEYEVLGRVRKSTFETAFASHSSHRYTKAFAIDSAGKILGESRPVERDSTIGIDIGEQRTKADMKPEVPEEFRNRALRALMLIAVAIGIAVLLGLVIGKFGYRSAGRWLRMVSYRSRVDHDGYIPVNQGSTVQHQLTAME